MWSCGKHSVGFIYDSFCTIIYVSLHASLTVKGAGHSGCVGTKQLGGIRLGASLFHLSINTLCKPKRTSERILLIHVSLSYTHSVDLVYASWQASLFYLDMDRYLLNLSLFFWDQILKIIFFKSKQKLSLPHSPAPPPIGRLQLLHDGPRVPFSFSSAFDEICLKSALSDGTSSQWGKRIPSLQGHHWPASMSEKGNQSGTVTNDAKFDQNAGAPGHRLHESL